MAILRLGEVIRLTGKDAEGYLFDTGRSQLPKTVQEYNRAMQETHDAWMQVDCAEAILLAHLAKDQLIKD